jgi:hypothetical protein
MVQGLLKRRLEFEGIMPERALLRLRRAGVDVFSVQKPQKNRIVFSIKKKDIEKVFAIYPKVCYNRNGSYPYSVRDLGGTGLEKYLDFFKKRIGLLLGGLLFCTVTLWADQTVMGVEFVGSGVYQRETLAALESQGIKPFSVYKTGGEDLVCAKILALDGVEFCSVKKNGLRVRVEMRLGEYGTRKLQSGNLYAAHTGEVIAITALRGTPLKAKGDSVQAGEPLVGGWFTKGEGEQVCVEPIARASIACAYEAEIDADSQEKAFATAYLALALDENATVQKTQITQIETGFLVRIEYIAIESINF